MSGRHAERSGWRSAIRSGIRAGLGGRTERLDMSPEAQLLRLAARLEAGSRPGTTGEGPKNPGEGPGNRGEGSENPGVIS